MTSPFLRKARERARRRKALALAPRHPARPETMLRMAMASIMRSLHGRIHDELSAYARRRRRMLGWLDDPELRAIYERVLDYGRELVGGEFVDKVKDAAQRTAASMREQIAKALGVKSVSATLARQVDALVLGMRQNAEQRVVDSIARAGRVLDEWDALDPETSPRAGDPDALDGMLDEGLSGVLGTAVAGATLAFVSTWADMNQEAQVASGVGSYIWVAQRDKFTRPAHAALDDAICEWRKPPLTADKSSSGEPCHAGEDFNCRCIAAPLLQ